MTNNTASKPGHSDILIGLQYGDEGKAKVIDLFGHHYDVIARFNGGANAGHTIQTSTGALSLRQLPSGILIDKCLLYIGSGCALNLEMLAAEIDTVRNAGVNLTDRLVVCSRTPIVQPHHIAFDRRNGALIGTTGNGIGPCYADRALRIVDGRQVSVTMRDLLNDLAGTMRIVEANARAANYEGERSLAVELHAFEKAATRIMPYVSTDDLFLVNRVKSGAKVLFEGAQSIELDVSKGAVPYVTSSHTVPAYAYVGGDLPPTFHRFTIGVAKAIVSRVGNGPMPGELGGSRSASYCMTNSRPASGVRETERANFDAHALLRSSDPFDLGMALRILTGEYGSGTGRPRRIGMLDLVQLKKAILLSGTNLLFLNKCDCLSLYAKTPTKTIPVITEYGLSATTASQILAFDSFESTCSSARRREELDPALVTLLEFIERYLDCPLLGVGLGPDRESNVISHMLAERSELTTA